MKHVIAFWILVSAAAAAANAAEKRPNILFAFADDWGRYASAYAKIDGPGTVSDAVQTPNFDRIAREGVLFRKAFVSAPSCTPCRSALLSGQHFWRTGRGAILRGAVWDYSNPSYALILRDSGYHIGETYKVWGPGTPGDAPYGAGKHAYEKAGGKFNQFSQNVTTMVAAGRPLEAAKNILYDEIRANFNAFLADRKPDQPFCYWFGPTNVHRKWIKGSGRKLWGIDPDKLKGKLPAFLPDVPEVREDFADYLGEAQAFDASLGLFLARLAEIGELDNTLIVVSGDHGAPGFPHGKCNLYDFGSSVSLAIRGPGVSGGRVVDDLITLPDLAPTFLEAGGLKPPAVMTGRSLVNLLRSTKSGQVEPARDAVFIGRERHVENARADYMPYPQRAIRTHDFLYIVNFRPERWPLGDPYRLDGPNPPSAEELTEETRASLPDEDAGPTKAWLVGMRNDPKWQSHFQWVYGKRPREELYDLKADPQQTRNVAAEPRYAATRAKLDQRLMGELQRTGDPASSTTENFSRHPRCPGRRTRGRPSRRRRRKRNNDRTRAPTRWPCAPIQALSAAGRATFRHRHTMRLPHPLFSFVALGLLAAACSATAAERPNVLFISIDDLRNDLGVLGAAHAKTPQLDAFAKTARVFTHHYVQVPTCGASRCALWRGRYPSVSAQVGNNGIKQTQQEWGARSLPAVFRAAGYRTLALGKLTHYPGGLSGRGWAEGPEELPGAWDRAWIPDGPWKNPEAIMHGYANGAARLPGKSPPWEAHDGPDEAYPDAWVAADAVKTLRELAAKKEPWFFGVGFFKPHLPFAAPKKWHDLHAAGVPDLKPEAAAKPAWPSGWHKSGEFRGNYGHAPGRDPDTDPDYARLMRRAYAASVSYTDAQVGRVLDELRRLGLEKNTIVVVWSDHGFLLGEHAIWGKHCLYEHALRSPLMLRHPGLAQPGRANDAVVETVDVFPTLAELCGLPAPADLDGRSLRAQFNDPGAPAAKPAHGFWTGGQRTLRNARWRLIAHPAKDATAPQVELFDYETDPDETRNHAAAHPGVVADLLTQLKPAPQR